MFGISIEHFVLLAIILLLFGPKRLPELGNKLGAAMKNFKDELAGVKEAKFTHLHETIKTPEPLKASTATSTTEAVNSSVHSKSV